MSSLNPLFDRRRLSRYPTTKDTSLQAWDAADEYLVHHIESTYSDNSNQHLLIVNDDFGALTTALANRFTLSHWHDSLLAQKAAQINLQQNHIPNPVNFIASTQVPKVNFDAVVIKPSKNHRLFHYQLALLAFHYPDIPVFIGLMQKQITTGLKAIITQNLDSVTPSLARKKSRIISGRLSNNESLPETYHCYRHKGLTIANYPNVFSADSIDIGTRFLLDHLAAIPKANSILDLGCGNGILAAFAAQHNNEAQIVGVDESYMAIASAQQTFELNHLNSGQFYVSNMLEAIKQQPFDLILCNPPFHHKQQTTTATAHKMFRQSLSQLTPGGQLWVVANRHLKYHQTIKKMFGNLAVLQSNAKFVILTAQANPS